MTYQIIKFNDLICHSSVLRVFHYVEKSSKLLTTTVPRSIGRRIYKISTYKYFLKSVENNNLVFFFYGL